MQEGKENVVKEERQEGGMKDMERKDEETAKKRRIEKRKSLEGRREQGEGMKKRD